MLYKIVTETIACFQTRIREKNAFSKNNAISVEFCFSVVIRDEIQLVVVIKESAPDNNKSKS